MGAVQTQICINNNFVEHIPLSTDNDVIIFKVGSDTNSDLAVDTFQEISQSDSDYYDIIIKDIDTVSQLNEEILANKGIYKVLFGHGTENGLLIKMNVYSWASLKETVLKQSKILPIIACYAGRLGDFFSNGQFYADRMKYMGLPYDIVDGEAGVVFAYRIIQAQEKPEWQIPPKLELFYQLKQIDCLHPLDKPESTERKPLELDEVPTNDESMQWFTMRFAVPEKLE